MNQSTVPEFGTVEVVQEIRIDAPPERVWEVLTKETSFWWQKDYYGGENPLGFVIEPKLGGSAREDWGNGEGAIWYTVTGVRAPSYLRLSGELESQYGGPFRTILTLNLSPTEGGTSVRLQDTIFGKVSEDIAKSIDGGWRFLFEGCFKPYVESGTRPELPAALQAS